MLTFIELDSRYFVEAFHRCWVDNTPTFHLGCSEFKSWFIDNCPGCLLLWFFPHPYSLFINLTIIQHYVMRASDSVVK